MFLVIEGLDGSGKSTQIRLLREWLASRTREPVLLVREPGGTALGESLRALLLATEEGPLTPETELFLFMAARADLCRRRLAPALARGEIVLADRFLWSSVVYQGYAGGLDPEEVLRIGRVAVGGLEPDLTIILDVPPETGEGRRSGVSPDRMEAKGLEFQARVRSGYLDLARRHPDRVAIIDGEGEPETVHERILAVLPAPWGAET